MHRTEARNNTVARKDRGTETKQRSKMNKQLKKILGHSAKIESIIIDECDTYKKIIHQRDTECPWVDLQLETDQLGEVCLLPLFEYAKKHSLGITLKAFKNSKYEPALSIEIIGGE